MSVPIVPLRELCKMDRQGLRSNDPVASRLPFIGVEHVGKGTGIIDFDNGSRIGTRKSTTFRFDERHVLYAKLRPYLNKVATPNFAGRCSTELVPLLPRDGIDRLFLAHLLRREVTVGFVMSSATGSRMPRTDMKSLLSMPVPLPPLDEQRRVVGILNRAAKIEQMRGQAEKRMREFIPALFIKLFGDPVQNPMGWEVESLGKLAVHTQYGTSKKANDRTAGVPMLRMGNVTYDGYLACADLKYVKLSAIERSKYALRTGDILFNRTNSKELVGKTGVWDGRFPAVGASYFIRVRLDETRVCPIYIWAFMNSNAMKHLLFSMARGAIGQANINAKELHSLAVPIPSLVHQFRFVELVETMRYTGTMAGGATDTAVALSKTLMSRLLENGK